MPDCDYIVIGAGHNGLVCAAYLAKAGQRVVVLEKHSVPGGCITTETIPSAPGFKLNIGALEHASMFDTPLVAELELERVGLRFLYREPAYYFPFLDGTAVPIYRDINRTVEAIAKFAPRDAEVYPAFMKFSEAFLGILGAVSTMPPPTFGELAGLMNADLGVDTEKLMWTLLTSPQSVLDDWFDDARVKTALAYYGAHTQTPPTQIGSGFAAMFLCGAHTASTARPVGGSGELISALVRAVEVHGGRVSLNADVTAILVENGRAVGVEIAGGEIVTAAKGVVSSIDARRVFLNLVKDGTISPALKRQIQNIKVAVTNVSEFKLDAALSEPLDWSSLPYGPEFAVSMQLLCPSIPYLDMVFADIRRGYPPEQPAMMTASASVLDPTLAPPGKHTLWLSSFAPYERRDGQSWDDAKEEFADCLVTTMCQYTPNLRRSIIAWELTSPLDWHRRTGSTRAQPNHLDLTLDQLLGYRPVRALSQYRTPVNGLYLTGSGTHPGGGVTGNPGYNTAQVIMQDLGLAPLPHRRSLRARAKRFGDLFKTFLKLRKYL